MKQLGLVSTHALNFCAPHGLEASAVVRVDPIDKLVVGFSDDDYCAVVADHAREFFGEGNRGIVGVGECVKRAIHRLDAVIERPRSSDLARTTK